jgi:hypothetical protein
MRKSVGQAPTAGGQTQQKLCQTSPDIGAEQENHTVGRGSTYDQKGLREAKFGVSPIILSFTQSI